MKVEVIGTTKPGYVATKEELLPFSGRIAGVCYMPNSFVELLKEPIEKTNKRVDQTIGSGHHSVYDHSQINMYFDNIPKALAMVLNNEKMYTTSEKSARYTKMVLSQGEAFYLDTEADLIVLAKLDEIPNIELFNKRFSKINNENVYFGIKERKFLIMNPELAEKENNKFEVNKIIPKINEKELYEKWFEIFKIEIRNKYQQSYLSIFSEEKIKKLAQENARYLTSVFTPTCMVYSCSFRQLNYIYNFIQNEIINPNSPKFYKTLKPAMIDFCNELRATGYIEKKLVDGKNRVLSFYSDYKPEKHFGDAYSLSYLGSFAQLAQAHRHRTLHYSMGIPKEETFYIPEIIKNNPFLVKEWVADCGKQVDCLPQGLMLNINEMGSLDFFILKMQERKCTNAQLEINKQTDATLIEFYNALKEKNHPRASDLEKWLHGSRCTAGYNCPKPCGFKEGITGERII